MTGFKTADDLKQEVHELAYDIVRGRRNLTHTQILAELEALVLGVAAERDQLAAQLTRTQVETAANPNVEETR
ncbi:hypothetical protein ACFWP3_40340 [Streptomyces sp. NPDC058525]|uniref:hypothetical protein n=1 Tax=Streptomyces sp. NPDC058525 TaxID=3346538 RepID=UPI00364966E1